MLEYGNLPSAIIAHLENSINGKEMVGWRGDMQPSDGVAERFRQEQMQMQQTSALPPYMSNLLLHGSSRGALNPGKADSF
jgi:hypothetical protein